jgi:hypothetical protein
MIFQIKRLFLDDRKNILSRPNQMDKDDKVILIKELAPMPFQHRGQCRQRLGTADMKKNNG